MDAILDDGTRLHYELSASQGPALVFLHPVGLDLRSWAAVAGCLPESYTVLSVDFRGHGRSGLPTRPFSIDDLAHDVARITTAALAEPVVLVGASMGGMVAQAIAVQDLVDVRGLILIDTASTFPDAMRATMRARSDRVLVSGMSELIDETIERWFSPAFRSARPDVVEATRQRLATDDSRTHAWAWRAISELDLLPVLGGVRAPTLVLTGSEDVSTPPAVGEAIAHAIAGARLAVIAGAGHMSYIEQPEQVARAVTGFIAEACTACHT